MFESRSKREENIFKKKSLLVLFWSSFGIRDITSEQLISDDVSYDDVATSSANKYAQGADTFSMENVYGTEVQAVEMANPDIKDTDKRMLPIAHATLFESKL